MSHFVLIFNPKLLRTVIVSLKNIYSSHWIVTLYPILVPANIQKESTFPMENFWKFYSNLLPFATLNVNSLLPLFTIAQHSVLTRCYRTLVTSDLSCFESAERKSPIGPFHMTSLIFSSAVKQCIVTSASASEWSLPNPCTAATNTARWCTTSCRQIFAYDKIKAIKDTNSSYLFDNEGKFFVFFLR